MRTLILGGPGAGKTTRLIQVVQAAMAAGLPPARIAYVAFTRAAAYRARDLACEKFGFAPKDLPYFRTLHSACFHAMGMRRRDVFSARHMAELSSMTGEDVEQAAGPVEVDGLARTSERTLRAVWEEREDELDWWRTRRFADAYRNYKDDEGLKDFTDMLRDYVDGPCGPLPVDLAVVDEAQDLSALQWSVVEKAFGGTKNVYYAGDDDQSIHEWAGADRQYFLHVHCECREVLPRSHRLPEAVFDLAQSIILQTTDRYHKDIVSAGKSGNVEWIGSADEIDLSSGSWLLLARTRHQLPTLTKVATDQGIPYSVDGVPAIDQGTVSTIRNYEKWRRGVFLTGAEAAPVLRCLGIRRRLAEDATYRAADLGVQTTKIWHDALTEIPILDREFLLAARRRGENLSSNPRIEIGTIHSSKGKEADNVLLLTDMTAKVRKGYERDPDPERRVWYVGVTRASQNLYLVQPATVNRFRM